MSRYAALIFSTLALGAACVAPVCADQRASYVFQGKSIVFERVVQQQGARAVAIDDPGVRSLLAALAATVAWQPNQRFILFTTAEPAVLSFALGDRRYDNGPVTQTAPFAPFLLDGHAFVPLDELLHALGLAIKMDGSRAVLEPQITSLDIQSIDGEQSTLVARGALPLNAHLQQSGGKVVVTFDGIGESLTPSRTFDSGPVRRIDVREAGTPSNPRTIVTLYTESNAGSAQQGTDDQRDVTIAFAGEAGAAAAGVAQATALPSPQTNQVFVNAVQTRDLNGATAVDVSIDGAASFEWHRLRPPDNRMWIDVRGAQLRGAPIDMPLSGVVTGVRVHQQTGDTVRIALSLADYQSVTIVPSDTGFTVTVDREIADAGAPRSGVGTTGENAQVAVSPTEGPWKFGTPPPSPSSTYVPANPRLIVIDPGHGGDDPGSIHAGLVEKIYSLDIAKRLREILQHRGWQVMLTREDDHDVGIPGDTDDHMLQARDDVANNNGARLFVSVHLNAFMNSGPNGATVYYYKPEDLALSRAVSRRISEEGGIKSDGIVKDKLYVVHHANMPAALVETAYLTNPDDRSLILDPKWREAIAKAIADGIEDYAGQAPPPSQSSGE